MFRSRKVEGYERRRRLQRAHGKNVTSSLNGGHSDTAAGLLLVADAMNAFMVCFFVVGHAWAWSVCQTALCRSDDYRAALRAVLQPVVWYRIVPCSTVLHGSK